MPILFPEQNLKHYGGTKKKASHVPLLSRPTEREFCHHDIRNGYRVPSGTRMKLE